jgi:transcriptional regulator with XRE-family HTH domain
MPRKTSNPLVAMQIKAGYSSAEKLAEALGISRVHVAQIFSGKSAPGWSLMAKMTATLGVTEKTLRFQLRKAQVKHHKRKLAKTRLTGSP